MKKIKHLLRSIKRIADKILGTFADEIYWKMRSGSWAEKYLGSESLNHPHRKLLIDKIERHYPFSSLLEVGCASGPNLYLVAKKFPPVKLYGTDINKGAIHFAQKWLKLHGIKSFILSQRRAEDLHDFKDESIDIVLTDATLICIGQDKIGAVMKELFRVAKNALIFVEWHSENYNLSFYNDRWIHNFSLLCLPLKGKIEKIEFTKIPDGMWGAEWGKHGYIIEVNKIPQK